MVTGIPRWGAFSAAATLAACLAMSACTGSSSGSGTASSPAATPSAGSAGKDVSAQYLTAPSQAPIAGANGSLPAIGPGKVSARLDVLSLEVRGGSTALRIRLSSDSDEQPRPSALSADGASDRVSGVTLTSGDNVFHPAVEMFNRPANRESNAPRCACGLMPVNMSNGGVEVSIQYGALTDGISTVQLKAPGFPAFSVPVTRG
jgi:hypothetical protein